MFTQIKLNRFNPLFLKEGDRLVSFLLTTTEEVPLAVPMIWDGKDFFQVIPTTKEVIPLSEVIKNLLQSVDLVNFTIERREAPTIEQQKDYAYGRVYRNYRRGLIDRDELHEKTSKIDVAFQDEIRAGKPYLNSTELNDIFKSVGMRVDLINTDGKEGKL